MLARECSSKSARVDFAKILRRSNHSVRIFCYECMSTEDYCKASKGSRAYLPVSHHEPGTEQQAQILTPTYMRETAWLPI